GLTMLVYALLVLHDRGQGLKDDPEINMIAIGNSNLDAARVISSGTDVSALIVKCVVVYGATHFYSLKATPILEAFDGVNTQHGLAQFGVQLVEDRLAEAHRRLAYDTGNDSANSVPVQPDLLNKGDHLVSGFRMRTPDDVVFRPGKIKFGIEWRRDVTYL